MRTIYQLLTGAAAGVTLALTLATAGTADVAWNSTPERVTAPVAVSYGPMADASPDRVTAPADRAEHLIADSPTEQIFAPLAVIPQAPNRVFAPAARAANPPPDYAPAPVATRATGRPGATWDAPQAGAAS